MDLLWFSKMEGLFVFLFYIALPIILQSTNLLPYYRVRPDGYDYNPENVNAEAVTINIFGGATGGVQRFRCSYFSLDFVNFY